MNFRNLFSRDVDKFNVPARNTRLEDLRLLAVDMETTDVDPRKGRIVSIGWVPIDGREIAVGEGGYVVVAGGEVGDSALIHGITDSQSAHGISEGDAIAHLMSALGGRVLLAHFAPLEVGYLKAAYKRLYTRTLDIPILDTFVLERRHMEKMGTYPRGEDLRLARVRKRYNLPAYRNHNALTDALACAEVYLAITANGRATTWGALEK